MRGKDNPGVEITLPACWDYPSRRDNFLFVLGHVNAREGISQFLEGQGISKSAQNYDVVYFSQWLRV